MKGKISLIGCLFTALCAVAAPFAAGMCNDTAKTAFAESMACPSETDIIPTAEGPTPAADGAEAPQTAESGEKGKDDASADDGQTPPSENDEPMPLPAPPEGHCPKPYPRPMPENRPRPHRPMRPSQSDTPDATEDNAPRPEPRGTETEKRGGPDLSADRQRAAATIQMKYKNA